MLKKIIITALLASMSMSAGAAKTIRFAAEASYPPFEFVGADNTLQGFDIDLANTLCREMNATCTFTNQAFDSLIPSLKFRRFDALISGIDITPEREQQVLFSTPYYDNSALFIAQKGKIASLSELKGKRVGIQNGTTHQKYLQEKQSDMQCVAYDSYQNAILDLKNGRIDAVFGDTAVVNEWLKQHPDLTSVGEKITDRAYFGRGLGIAVRQGNVALQTEINAALDKAKADGSYQSVYNKWFQ